MRMRFKPYARPELLACDFHVHEPLTHGGHWHELYARPDQPWHLELGCGKGGFLAQIAPAHPDINYLGIDITDKVLILAKRKVEAAYAERGIPADNVKIASLDIERLGNAFTPDDRVSRIYINFCDPWPRSNQKKRRLTHGNFLQLYRRVLPLGGEIHFKSDNDKLFEWSLEEIPRFGFRLSQVTRDLHADGPVGVMTDYEAKFYQQGVTINRCVAAMVPWEAPAQPEEPEEA